jgi:hypothetical protein
MTFMPAEPGPLVVDTGPDMAVEREVLAGTPYGTASASDRLTAAPHEAPGRVEAAALEGELRDAPPGPINDYATYNTLVGLAV